MSNSGRSTINVQSEHDRFELKGFTCELSANSFIPPRRTEVKERNCFNSHKEVLSSVERRREKNNTCLSFRQNHRRSTIKYFKSNMISTRRLIATIDNIQNSSVWIRQKKCVEKSTIHSCRTRPNRLFRKKRNRTRLDRPANTVVVMIVRSTWTIDLTCESLMSRMNSTETTAASIRNRFNCNSTFTQIELWKLIFLIKTNE